MIEEYKFVKYCSISHDACVRMFFIFDFLVFIIFDCEVSSTFAILS
jgi:hypothetical protein